MDVCALIYNDPADLSCQAEILSRPACSYMVTLAKAFGCQKVYLAGQACSSLDVPALETDFSGEPSLFSQVEGAEQGLVFFESLPALTRGTLGKLMEQSCGLLTDENHHPMALYAPWDVLQRLSGRRITLVDELRALGPMLTEVSLSPEDGCAIQNGLDVYRCQELLRQRINRAHMEAGVIIVDPTTTHISPDALVESGSLIMPGCFIYGHSHIEATAKVGPNAMIVDSVIGCGASVNSSQVIESTIGAQTTVGPYAYIRPGCDVGEKVRIGDFVELKNSTIGEGTKISHLTYVGDSDVGGHVNFGCGTVTVNYDGTSKFRTVIGDHAFIGCNTNLVAPVRVGEGAYTAAGSTITDEVPADSLAIARTRQTVKKQWAAKRRNRRK